MALDITNQPLASRSAAVGAAIDRADPRALLRPRLRVLGAGGKRLGRIDTLVRDALTGHLLSLTVRHGLRGRRVTSLPARQVKWVNDNSVVLDVTKAAFKRLPRLTV